MKINLIGAILGLIFLTHSSSTLAEFKCPDPPMAVGEHVDSKKVQGDIAASVAKVFNAPVGTVDVKGELRTLSKHIVKEYPGVNEGTSLLMVGSVCCQILGQVKEPADQVRLYRDCMTIRQEGEQKAKSGP